MIIDYSFNSFHAVNHSDVITPFKLFAPEFQLKFLTFCPFVCVQLCLVKTLLSLAINLCIAAQRFHSKYDFEVKTAALVAFCTWPQGRSRIPKRKEGRKQAKSMKGREGVGRMVFETYIDSICMYKVVHIRLHEEPAGST